MRRVAVALLTALALLARAGAAAPAPVLLVAEPAEPPPERRRAGSCGRHGYYPPRLEASEWDLYASFAMGVVLGLVVGASSRTGPQRTTA